MVVVDLTSVTFVDAAVGTHTGVGNGVGVGNFNLPTSVPTPLNAY